MMHGEWFFACLRYDFCNAAPAWYQSIAYPTGDRYPIIIIIDGDIRVFLLL